MDPMGTKPIAAPGELILVDFLAKAP